MQHFYDSFALVSQICVRREALSLFGLREDELLPDLHITKVSAEVIQLAAHEVDPEPTKAESEGGTSDSDGSWVTRTRMILPLRWQLMQNSMSSCKLLMVQWARTFMTKRFHWVRVQQTSETGAGSWEMAPGEVVFFFTKMCGPPWPCSGWVLLGSSGTRVSPPESLLSLHRVAKCLTMQLAVYLAKEVAAILRAVLTHETKKLYNDGRVHLLCSNYWKQPIYQELLHSSSRYNATREGKESDPAVAWPVLQHTLGRPKSGSHQLLAPAFVTGLLVSACRYGFRPTGPSSPPTVATEGG